MPYDIDAIRKKVKEKQAGRQADPDEFRPEKGKSANEPVYYRFFILPPFDMGELIKGGKAKHGMDNQFYVTHANHWFGEKPYPCPRVYGDGSGKCKVCDYGFALLKDEKVKANDEVRRKTVSTWMPNQQYMMNIYFPADKKNPEDLHNRVMFYNAPKTVLDICTTALMRDDPGDPESPEAFGIFFDESNGFLFELQVLKSGKQNSYKTSKFLATPRPMIRNQDGSANEKALTKLLESRHDLFAKIEVPNQEKIDKIFQVMTNGDDSADDKGGFDDDETATKTAVTSKAATTTRKAAPAAAPVDDEEAPAPKAKPAKAPVTVADDDEAPAPKTTAKPKPTVVAADDDLSDEAPLAESGTKVAAKTESAENPEIENLLAQLDDDDE